MENVLIPTGKGITGFVYKLLSSIQGWGWISYGFAIVFLTLFIKLMVAPLDFFNKYFTRKNQIKTQAVADELAELNQNYGNDPMTFARKRQELYRKNGIGGFFPTIISLVSVILTMVIFFQVFAALRTISKENITYQYEQLATVYEAHKDDDEATLKELLNQTYQETQTRFIWVKNIWRPDTFWDSADLSFKQYNQQAAKKLPDEQKATYEKIYSLIDHQKSNGNGWLLLGLLAGLASFGSLKLSQFVTSRTAPKKKEKAKPVEIITYSLRDAKNQSTPNAPAVDPAQMGKMMQYIMPLIMVVFGLTQTAAFAIYMISSSVITTALTAAFAFLIEAILKRQKPKEPKKDFDATVINPHAKYFKGGKK